MSLMLAGDVELNPGPGTSTCTPECKHNRQSKGDMITTCSSATWIHEDCMGISSDEERGIWPCPDRRQTSERIKFLTSAVRDLTNLVGKISEIIKTLDRERRDDLGRLSTQIQNVTQQNAELSNKIARLTLRRPYLLRGI